MPVNLAIGGVFAKVLIAVFVALIVAGLIRSRFVRVLRLGRGLRTPVRYRWAFFASRAARLHRRLQVVAGVCLDALGGRLKPSRDERRARRRGDPGATPVRVAERRVRAVIEEAVSLDTRLAETPRAGLRPLSDEVARLEATAKRALAELRHARADRGPVAPDTVLDERPASTQVEPPDHAATDG